MVTVPGFLEHAAGARKPPGEQQGRHDGGSTSASRTPIASTRPSTRSAR